MLFNYNTSLLTSSCPILSNLRSSEQFTLPEVGHAHTVLKLCYLHSQLADLSTEYLVTVTTLSILTEDNRLSKHVQQGRFIIGSL